MAEQTLMLELPASDKGAVADLSSLVASGRALVSLTSVIVSLLIKMSSPFQAV